MTAREEHIKSKVDCITKLKLEQLNCIKQMTTIALKGGSKYTKVTLNRAFRMIGWAIKARQIKLQIDMICAQPIAPVEGLPLVGGGVVSDRPEEIIPKDCAT